MLVKFRAANTGNITMNAQSALAGRGFCVADHQVCDDVFDCQDHSDELNCTNVCTEEEFRCSNGSDWRAGGRCVPLSYLCDREFDCTGWSFFKVGMILVPWAPTNMN